MASVISPSPSSTPVAVPPVVSTPNATIGTPPPTSNPPSPSNSSSAPLPPQSPPPPVVVMAPPPSPPQSSPPPAPPPSLPASPPPSALPPSLPASPPPSASPPSLPASPPPSAPPPSLPASPPPSAPPPPLVIISSPPPPLSSSSPPPPLGVSSPPPPPATSPPPSPPRSMQPPPPPNSPPPPGSSPPPSPLSTPPPSNSTPPPVSTPPPPSSVLNPPSPPSNSTPPPVSTLPPPSSVLNPPPPPSISTPPPVSSPSPPSSVLNHPPPPSTNNTSVGGSTPTAPLPSFPEERPTSRSTTPGPNITGAGATSRGSGTGGGAVAIGIVVGLFALSLLVLAVWYNQKRKRRRDRSNDAYVIPSSFPPQGSESSLLKAQHSTHLTGAGSMHSPDQGGTTTGNDNSRSWFSYEELSDATDGFSESNVLGEGGFGCVFKGVLVDGREVAVKQLKIGGGQGEREFRAEVEIISRVHHRHLVSLVGYCISHHQRLLVYQYVPNDTLHYHLHGEGRPVMDWATRARVAAGAARGIAYLHEDCHPRIYHRDIKSSNILLDDNFDAQVADFGLAKLAMDSNATHVTTRVMGTFGYMAPEYASSGKLTDKSDVYSYGVVLLELITGRKPVDDSQPLGDESLVEWARPLLVKALDQKEFEELVDPRLEKKYVEVEMLRMIEAAAACIRHLASKRPKMSQVVRALDSINEHSDLTNGMRLGQSEIFDSREQSAQIKLFQRMAFGSQDYNTSELSNYSRTSRRS